jgi:hypothetical protein
MTEKSFTYLPTLDSRLIRPLRTLLGALEDTPATALNEVETGGEENGYATAVVVLAAMLFEATINIVRHQRGESVTPETRHAAEYFATISPDSALATDLREVFAVRDVIVHSHLWEAQVTWGGDPEQLRFIGKPKLVEGYGDTRFREVLDCKSRCSRHLRLNLFLSRIGRRDAYVVLKTIGRALKTLEAPPDQYRTWGHEPLDLHGQEFTLFQMIDALPDER